MLLFLAACEEERLTDDPPEDASVPIEDAAVEDAAEPPDVGALDASEPDGGFVPSTRIELGSVTLSNGVSDELAFELPADVTTFTVVIQGPVEVMFGVARLDGPTGLLVSDDASNISLLESYLLGPFAAQFKSPNRVTGKEGVASALFPNNPSVNVSGGTYHMKVRGLQVANGNGFSGNAAVAIDYKSSVTAHASIDVHVYLTGAGGLTTDTATAALLTGALARLAEIYAQANIELGSVSFHDIDPSFATRDVTAASLGPMFQLSLGNGPGLHYFLVDRFVGSIPGGMVGGIAGGLPGPPLRPGTVSSGVAVAVTAANGDARVLAHVMAHEGGHWLGLFHTSEITGTADQLDDTPAGQAGQTFLMYPAVGGGQSISTSQADVMLRHLEVVAK